MEIEDTSAETPEETTNPEAASPPISLGIDNFGNDDKDPKPSKSESKADDKDSKKKPDKADKDKKPESRKRKFKLGDLELDWDDDGGDVADFSKHSTRHKVDGKEIDVPLGELGKNYELRAASYKRLEEGNARDKRFIDSVTGLRENRGSLEDFLRDQVGIKDPYEWAMEGLKARIEEEQLSSTDPQRYRQIVNERAQKEAAAEFRRQQWQQQQAMLAQQEQEAGQRFVDAITSGREQLGLQSPTALGALHVMEQRFIRMGRDPRAEVQALLQEAADIYHADIRQHVRGLSEEQLLELIGPSVIRKLNDFQIRKAKGNGGNASKPAEQPVQKVETPKKKYKSEREILKKLYK